MKKSKLRSASAVRKNAAARDLAAAQRDRSSQASRSAPETLAKTAVPSKSGAGKKTKTNPQAKDSSETPAPRISPKDKALKVSPATGLGKVSRRNPDSLPSKPLLRLPSILLEGDEPSSQPAAPPAPAPISVQQDWVSEAPPETDSVPEAYGTGKLCLVARDPDCIYAHWDLSPEQQQSYNALSSDKHLVLRVFVRNRQSKPVREVHLHPESQSWFVYVDAVDSVFVADLGYYSIEGGWVGIAESLPVTTPSKSPSPEKTVQFGMVNQSSETAPAGIVGVVPSIGIPTHLAAAAAHQQAAVGGAAGAGPDFMESGFAFAPSLNPAQDTLADAAAALRFGPLPVLGVEAPPWHSAEAPGMVVQTWPAIPANFSGEVQWTEALEHALEEISTSTPGPGAASSQATIQTAPVVRGQGLASVSAPQSPPPESQASPVSVGRSEQPAAISSELGQPPSPDSRFWFTVNAELVIYGATEPSATVTIGGRSIELRPDGTFSYRFSLPDGRYHLPITAVSVDKQQRYVALNFSRNTVSSGEIGNHPQDPVLRPPEVENLG